MYMSSTDWTDAVLDLEWCILYIQNRNLENRKSPMSFRLPEP